MITRLEVKKTLPGYSAWIRARHPGAAAKLLRGSLGAIEQSGEVAKAFCHSPVLGAWSTPSGKWNVGIFAKKILLILLNEASLACEFHASVPTESSNISAFLLPPLPSTEYSGHLLYVEPIFPTSEAFEG